MSATLKSWLSGRASLDATPASPSKDTRSIDLAQSSMGRTHSFNDFSCSAADDAENGFAAADRGCKNDRFRPRASTSAVPIEASAGPTADWLQFRRPPLSRASCSATITSPINITPRTSMISSASGPTSSDDGAPETPSGASGWQQRKSESIEHWEWSELMHGSSL